MCVKAIFRSEKVILSFYFFSLANEAAAELRTRLFDRRLGVEKIFRGSAIKTFSVKFKLSCFAGAVGGSRRKTGRVRLACHRACDAITLNAERQLSYPQVWIKM